MAAAGEQQQERVEVEDRRGGESFKGHSSPPKSKLFAKCEEERLSRWFSPPKRRRLVSRRQLMTRSTCLLPCKISEFRCRRLRAAVLGSQFHE
eukprot:scaffold5304_cov150-Skeletonema_marinoi.AAC.5